jgi:hypothetical protein
MCKDKVVDLNARVELESRGHLWHAMREGARQMLHLALEAEVQDYIEEHAHLTAAECGRRMVVRNGYHKERTIQTELGPLPIEKPRVDDQREGERFTSGLIPPYVRRSPSLDGLIPACIWEASPPTNFPRPSSPFWERGQPACPPPRSVA